MELDEIIAIRHKGVGQIKCDHPLAQIQQQIGMMYTLQRKVSDALQSLYYANGVHKYSFGIGDVVEHNGVKYEVVKHDMGMFWGKKVGERKLKFYPLYSQDNFKLIKNKL